MKILLYKPNDLMVSEEESTHNLSEYDSVFPYSLAVVGSVLRGRGHNVIGLDPRPEKINFEETMAAIERIAPDAIVINVSITAIDLDFCGIKKIKEKLGCKIIALVCLGFEEEAMRRYPEIDVLIRREWGYAVADALLAVERGLPLREVKGIYFWENGNVIKTEAREHIHLEDTPLPAFDLFPVKKYDHYQILMTAGCSHHCLFCHFGRYPLSGWEHKSAERAIQEIKEFKKFGNKFFRILDNELTLGKDFAKALLRRIIEEKIDFVFDVNIRASTIDDELAGLLVKAGCLSVGYGVESGVQNILDLNLKELTLNQILECQRILDGRKIYSRAYCLIGLRGDTRETILETFRFIREDLKSKDASFDIVVPYPDTAFHTFLKQNGLIKNFTIDNLIWIYKNIYNWKNLRDTVGVKPEWRIGDLTFDDLLRMNKEYYHLVPHGNDRRKLYFMFVRHPLFTAQQMLRIFTSPGSVLQRVKNIILNK